LSVSTIPDVGAGAISKNHTPYIHLIATQFTLPELGLPPTPQIPEGRGNEEVAILQRSNPVGTSPSRRIGIRIPDFGTNNLQLVPLTIIHQQSFKGHKERGQKQPNLYSGTSSLDRGKVF
jgi:hypothetical protein